MGLRPEQFEIDELLKYFVARNEYDREILIDKLKHLTSDELTLLDITSIEDIYNFFNQVRTMIDEAAIHFQDKSAIVNKVGVDESTKFFRTYSDAYYYTYFLMRVGFERVLDLRNVKYYDFYDVEMLYNLVVQSNPITPTEIITEIDDIDALYQLDAKYAYRNKDALIRVGFLDVLTQRNISIGDSIAEVELDTLDMKVQVSNPGVFKNVLENDPYLSPNSYYDIEFLQNIGLKIISTMRGYDVTNLNDQDMLLEVLHDFKPKSTSNRNQLPLNGTSYYEDEFALKYGLVQVLKNRDLGDIYSYDSSMDVLTNAVLGSNTDKQDTEYMSLKQVTTALNGDLNFYNNIEQQILDINDRLVEKYYVDSQDIIIKDYAYSLYQKIVDEFINYIYAEFTQWTKDRIDAINNELDNLKEDITTSRFNVKTGTNQFLGLGQELRISHNLGETPDFVVMNPAADNGGNLGETWVSWDDTYIYVHNSGIANTEFDWVAIKNLDSSEPVNYGFENFIGNSDKLTIPHGLPKIPDFVTVQAWENPTGDLGEYYFDWDAENIYVYNTGDAKTKFHWAAFNTDDYDTSLSLTGYFSGSDDPTLIPHGITSNVPFLISVTPDVSGNNINEIDCMVGEISVDATETRIKVYNSGSYCGKFKLMLVNPYRIQTRERFLKYHYNWDRTQETVQDGYWYKSKIECTGTQFLSYNGYLQSTRYNSDNKGLGNFVTIESDVLAHSFQNGDIVGILAGRAEEDIYIQKALKSDTSRCIPFGIFDDNIGIAAGGDTSKNYPVVTAGIHEVNVDSAVKSGEYVVMSSENAGKGKAYVTDKNLAEDIIGIALTGSGGGAGKVLVRLSFK